MQSWGKHLWAVDECVAMNGTQADKLGIFQPRDHSENFFLEAPTHLGLKTNQIVKTCRSVFLAQLNYGMEPFSGFRMF